MDMIWRIKSNFFDGKCDKHSEWDFTYYVPSTSAFTVFMLIFGKIVLVK